MGHGTVDKVAVIRTGSARAHTEHVYGTQKPALWWIFTSKTWVELPINVYVIEHPNGLVLFDTGADPRVASDPEYWPDRVTKLFMDHIFQWHIGPGDKLANQLELAGYDAADVTTVVLSHLHADHAGGIGDVPQADLFVSADAWDHLMGPYPEREMVMRRDLLVPQAKWNHLNFEPVTDPLLSEFEESCDLMGDGSLIVLPTPGHFPGSVSMLIYRVDAPPVLLIGDLTYSEELLDRDQVAGTGDKKLLRESYAKVRSLKRILPDLVVLASHDATAADRLGAHRAQSIPATA